MKNAYILSTLRLRLGAPKAQEGMNMKMKTVQGMTLVLLMLMAAFAGCLGDETSDDSSSSDTATSDTSTSDSSDSS
ncbi:MAG: hypothetical protein CMB72_02540, partial [Euryarchaeota archaeon]|nr:hypothetical protein [Euryarchaeota archaeon]